MSAPYTRTRSVPWTILATLPWACAPASSDASSGTGSGNSAGRAGGAIEIFDGESLAGWDGDPRYWSVEDGAIVGRTSAETPLERTTYLLWRGGDVRDFELELEFQLETSGRTANSGVQFRSREVGRFAVAGYQADLSLEEGLSGTLYEQFGARQLMARLGEEVHFSSDGKKRTARFAGNKNYPGLLESPGWHSLRIYAKGSEIELTLDGLVTSRAFDRHRFFSSTSGLLALQLHSGSPMEVRFRHLRLHDLGGVRDERERVEPQWIWTSYGAEPGEEAWFRREFEVEGELKRALLWGMADDALEVYLNGDLIATAEGFDRMLIVQPLPLRAGKNVLAAWVRNAEEHGGLFLSLRARHVDGRLTHIGTDPDFLCAEVELPGWNLPDPVADAALWSASKSVGPLGTEPWGVPPRRSINPQVSALAGDAVGVPEGFRAELVYSVPRARQGSWVALTFDDAGRAITSDENGPLFRIELPEGSRGPRVERLPIDGGEIGEAQGLLYAFDALYVSVSRSKRFASGLYRLRDTDGDDRFDETELLRALEGEGEHGLHAVLLGPDEKLYLFAGNAVALPEDARASWGASLLPTGLLPPRVLVPAGRPGELVRAGRAGWVARTDRDGRRFELFAYGLRNPYDGAFDAEGDLFCFDSDMEWDLGLPWYRSSRLYHIVRGADYGARYGTGKWPYSFADTLPPAVEVGRTSPTGMVSGHELGFGGRWSRALFAGDWLNGRILAFFPEPVGSSYRAEFEVFAEGQPLQITDLAAGPDGGLYFTTGGRSTQSGLYRISADVPGPSVAVPSNVDRRHRRQLEGDGTAPGSGELRAALASEDRFLRNTARFGLEQRGLRGFEVGDDEGVQREVWLAQARTLPPDRLGALLDELGEVQLGGLPHDAQAILLRATSIVLQRNPALGVERGDALTERFLPLLPSPYPSFDRELAALLVHLEAAAVVPLAVQRLADEDLTEAFYWAFLLRDMRVGWTPELRAKYFEFQNKAMLELEGGYDVPILLAKVRSAALAGLSPSERQRLGPLLTLPAPGSEDTLAPRDFVREWTLTELRDELLRLREPRDLERGARVYREASCAACHVYRDVGSARAPELTGAGARFSTEDLLESIVEPSRAIAEPYRMTIFHTVDGAVQVGRVVREGTEGVMLRPDTPPFEGIFIPAEEIAERYQDPLSGMPSGLLNTHSVEEILDLLAYLLATP